MTASNVKGFVQWMFAGCSGWVKNIYFWGMVLIGLSLVATLGGCPAPWPFRIYAVGLVMVLVECVRQVLKLQYQRYRNELERTERELMRKN
jgi:hypothetical protein